MTTLLIAVTLSVVVGLRLPEPTVNSRSFKTAGCQETKGQQDLGDIVKSVKSFYKSKNLIIYPAVLTMVAAMRYGGVSVELDGQRHVADHDLDFMVVFPKTLSSKGIFDTLIDFKQHLKATTGLDAVVTPMPLQSTSEGLWLNEWIDPLEDSVAGYLKTVKKNFRSMDFMIQRHTILTDKWNDDGLISESRLISKRFYEYHNSDKVNISTKLAVSLGAGSVDNSTHVTFWFPAREHHEEEGWQPSQTNTTLFMGHEFPFPKDADMIYRTLMDEFGSFHKAAHRAHSLCDFMIPDDIFEEDLPVSSNVLQYTSACIEKLHKSDYASFQYCKDAMPKHQ